MPLHAGKPLPPSRPLSARDVQARSTPHLRTAVVVPPAIALPTTAVPNLEKHRRYTRPSVRNSSTFISNVPTFDEKLGRFFHLPPYFFLEYLLHIR